MLPLFIVGIPIYRWIETRRWLKSFMGLVDRSRAQSLGTYAKGVEIFAILLAVIAFLYEFGYEKPRDRASRNAQLLAQIADLSYDENNKIKSNSSAIENIMTLLAKEKVSMHGISVPKVELIGAQLAGAILPLSNLLSAELRFANLSSANLSGARNLTQSMLDSALPSPPPVNLPEGLEWPFERGQDGEWVRKEQSPAAE